MTSPPAGATPPTRNLWRLLGLRRISDEVPGLSLRGATVAASTP
jgi:hypothetical protein